MLLDYRELSLNKAVDDCSAVWMGCVNCYVISSIKAPLTISFCLAITCTLNSLRTWLAYSRAFLHPTMYQTRANPSRKWLQSQSKNRVKNPRSGMGVASLLNNRPFPSAQNRAKPGSVKAALELENAEQIGRWRSERRYRGVWNSERAREKRGGREGGRER